MSDKDSKLSTTDLRFLGERSTGVNVMYFQYPGYKNMKNSWGLEIYVETYNLQDDKNLNVNESEILILLDQRYCMHCYELSEWITDYRNWLWVSYPII